MSATSAPSIPLATDIPVLVPWRTDNGARAAIWERLRARWIEQGWTVVEGHPGDGPFNRAAAQNNAARLAGDWDVAIITDADSIVPPERLHAAIRAAHETGRMVIAHDRWVNVHTDEQDQFLTTGSLTWRPDREVYKLTVSSMLACPRSVWDAVGGYDERFRGYGYEDNAFYRACEILTGEPVRLHGSVFHLSHEQHRPHMREQLRDPLVQMNRARWRRYKLATTPRQIRALMAE